MAGDRDGDVGVPRWRVGLVSVATASGPDTEEELRRVWQDRLEHLAPYAVDPTSGGILPYEIPPGVKLDWRNAENPELFAVGVFPLITLDSPAYELGVKTFRARRNVNGYGWTTDSICAARLGLAGSSPRRPAAAGPSPPPRCRYGSAPTAPAPAASQDSWTTSAATAGS